MSLSDSNTPACRSVNPFLRSWAWKREHRPDRDRFNRPYMHEVAMEGHRCTLCINQARFLTRGFASTVWDSAIVLSKYLERWPMIVKGKSCIELGAGCGLPGITAACLGASSVVLTDLEENLTLLKENVLRNKVSDVASVSALEWGRQDHLLAIQPCDVILAADVMYDACIIPSFLKTVQSLATHTSQVLLAYGRNRQAEEQFSKDIRQWFSIERVDAEELDEVYQCIDVDVFRIKKETEVSA